MIFPFPQHLASHPDFLQKPILNTEPTRTNILVLLPFEARNREFLHRKFNWIRQLRSVSNVTIAIENGETLLLSEVSPAISAIKPLEEEITAGKLVQDFGAIFTDLDLCHVKHLEPLSIATGVPIFTPVSTTKSFHDSPLFRFDPTRPFSARNTLRAFLSNPGFFIKELRKIRRSFFHEYGLTNPSASIITCTNRPGDLKNILENFSRQNYRHLDFILGLHGKIPVPPDQQAIIDQLRDRIQIKIIDPATSLGFALNELIALSNSDYILRFDSDDWYGENYTQDTLIDLVTTGADLVGKRCHFSYLSSINSTVLLDKTSDKFIAGPTFAGPLTTFTRFPFENMTNGEDSRLLQTLRERNLYIESTDRYNFLAVRKGSTKQHTHKVSDLAYLTIGSFFFSGFATDQTQN